MIPILWSGISIERARELSERSICAISFADCAKIDRTLSVCALRRAEIKYMRLDWHFIICCLIQRVQLACVYYLHQSLFYFAIRAIEVRLSRVTLWNALSAEKKAYGKASRKFILFMCASKWKLSICLLFCLSEI
jgi:hypothetical protein